MLDKIARINGKSRQGVVKHPRLYRQWYAMRRRCYDPKFICYPYYGAKGIKVCDEWRTCYETFQTWALAHGWKKNLTLDRIDCKGNYEPANCRWLTLAEQQCNRLSWNIPMTRMSAARTGLPIESCRKNLTAPSVTEDTMSPFQM